MINLFLTLIVVLAFICILTVIIGIKSHKTVYPVVSVVCGVFIIACAFCCVIETESSESSEAPTKAYIPVTESKTAESKTEIRKEIPSAAEAEEVYEPEEVTEELPLSDESDPDDMSRIVYITKTGTKYHYSYFCSNTDFYECTLEQALERGLEPCQKCAE